VVPLPLLDPAALTTAYETLRAQVVGDPVVGRPAQGLALLYRRGLPAWLAQMMTSPAAEVDRSAAGDRATATTAAGATETVLVVASMVLARRAGGQP
jgi:hypothetical protein